METEPFRFLTHEEFERLPQGGKMAYLERAVRELGVSRPQDSLPPTAEPSAAAD